MRETFEANIYTLIKDLDLGLSAEEISNISYIFSVIVFSDDDIRELFYKSVIDLGTQIMLKFDEKTKNILEGLSDKQKEVYKELIQTPSKTIKN